MAINLNGKTVTEKLLAQLEVHGYYTEMGVAKSRNDPACQAIIDGWDELPEYKDARILAIKTEGLTRIQVVLPGVKDFDTLELMRELWLSVAPAARAPTATLTSAINIYTAGRNGVNAVKAATTKAQVDAVVVAWP